MDMKNQILLAVSETLPPSSSSSSSGMDGSLNFTCQVCNNVDFDDGSSDGFFYCLTCGSRAEDIISTPTTLSGCDDHRALCSKDTIFLSGYRRIKSAKPNPNTPHLSQQHDQPSLPLDFRSQPSSTYLTYHDYFKEVRKRYLMALQIMLQLQTRALVHTFKVSKLVPQFASSIWLRLLPKSGVFATNWAEQAISESESQPHKDVDDTFHVHKHGSAGPVNIFGKPAVMIWFSSLKTKIPLSSSLIISFMACHLAREPILANDIHEWALEGKLPYFDAFVEIGRQLGPPSPAFPLNSKLLCRPSWNVPLKNIESRAASIAESIGLLLPPVNFHAIASRFLSGLSLPRDAVFPHVCRIYEWAMPPDLYFSSNNARFPTHICVMAVIIVAVRCFYNLNGFGLYEQNILNTTTSIPGTTAEVIKILSKKNHDDDKVGEIPENFQNLSKYLKYCDDVVFAGLGPSFDEQGEEAAMKQLKDFYSEHDGSNVGGGGGGEGGDANVKKSHEMKSRDERIRDVKEDMGEKLFNYIPPRKRPKRDGYLHYNRKMDGGCMAYVAHADYYTLLCSCAQVAKVDPRIMHIGALRLENRLAWIEKHVDRLLSNHAGAKSEDSMDLSD